MSGHSKWHKIKRAKESTDKKKSQLYGKLVRDIQVAARHDANPDSNAALREAITRAREANMPQSNIARLLQQKNASQFNQVIYEGFGPGGIALLMVASTDSPNRTVSALRQLLKKHGGRLGEPGSVRWKFKEVNIMTVEQLSDNPSRQESLELALTEAGAAEINKSDQDWKIISPPDKTAGLLSVVRSFGVTPVDSETGFISLQPLVLMPHAAQQLQELLQELSDQPDIASVYPETLQYT